MNDKYYDFTGKTIAELKAEGWLFYGGIENPSALLSQEDMAALVARFHSHEWKWNYSDLGEGKIIGVTCQCGVVLTLDDVLSFVNDHYAD